jgi:rod shape-determining protein MreD
MTSGNRRAGWGFGRRIASASPLLLLVALIVVAQATLTARIRLAGASPDLLLAAVVAWSLLQGIEAGLIWAFAGGLLFDLVTGMPLGASSLALMTICFLTGLGESNLFQGNVFLPVIIVALATPLHGWIILLTQQLRHLNVDWLGVTLRVILPELALNVAAVVIVYPALRWLAQRVGAERMDW